MAFHITLSTLHDWYAILQAVGVAFVSMAILGVVYLVADWLINGAERRAKRRAANNAERRAKYRATTKARRLRRLADQRRRMS